LIWLRSGLYNEQPTIHEFSECYNPDMSNYSFVTQPSRPDRYKWNFLWFLIAATGTILAGLVIITLLFSISSSGKILPGIAVNNIPVSGLTVPEASAVISSRLAYPSTGRIVLVYGEKSWLATPAELGLRLDADASALNAYDAGRGHDPFTNLLQSIRSRTSGYNLAPLLTLDESAIQRYLVDISAGINQPVVDAGISIKGVDVSTKPSQIGREVDINATLQLVSTQLQTLQDGVVYLVVKETSPSLVDAEPLAATARSILSAPLVLTIPDATASDAGPWTIDPSALAGVLTIASDTTHPEYPYLMTVNRESLRAYMEGIAPDLERSPQNARFIFNDDTHQLDVLAPSTTGRSLDVEGSLDDIISGLAGGQHTIPLRTIITQPQVSDKATGQELGITQLIHSETSYFYGSSSARINNIHTAAANFHGLLIAPGENFSMASAMKDVTLDNGYTEALIIYGNQTIKGVGGGVCQVSTTLFRAAFFSGFPITERYAHAYRVGYYEQTRTGDANTDLAGLDATVFIPVVDLKFTNDTPYWLLMETYVSDSWITWKFYSTSDGRTVEWKNDGLQNVVKAPKPLYKENPDLPEGKIKQIDWEADGADVHVSRIVYLNGQIYFQDDFNTHYAPWQAVYEFGPGTKLPKGALTQ